MKQTRRSIMLVACVLIGCKSAPVFVAPPPAAPAFTVSGTRSESSAALVDRNAKLSEDISKFPGNNGEEHRGFLVPTLDDLSKALRLANGPVESPEFSNRIAVIDAARKTAMIGDVPAARVQAVENQALLATEAALQEITTRYLFDDPELPAMLDALDSAVGKASATVGPLHDLDATHAFGSVENVIQRMSDDMVERFGTGGGGSPPPPPGAR